MDQSVRDSKVREDEEISRECELCCGVIMVALMFMERAGEGTFILQAHDTVCLDLN